ncbi:MAG: hypothetical protein ABSF32_11160 [Ignavibacteria bacterium]|jgi:hypothetical protein
MKLSEFKADSYFYSSKVSDICRQLAFAGIAVIWIFKNTDGVIPVIADSLVKPLFLFAVSLAFDLLQYISGTIVWTIFFRINEKGLSDVAKDDKELSASIWWSSPIWLFFGLKIITVAIGFSLLIDFLLKKLY